MILLPDYRPNCSYLALLSPTINTQRKERENKRTDKLTGKSGNAPGCNGKEDAKFGRGQIDALI